MSIPQVSLRVVLHISMSDLSAERLRAARQKAGFSSASEAADAFGWKEAGYRHHENGTRGFGLDAARKYGRAFHVKPGWLLGVDGVDDAPPANFPADATLLVEGAVAAGVWREPNDGFPAIEIDTPPVVPTGKRFGLIVDGYSMDLHYEPGAVLDCVSIFSSGIEPEPGDHVIVERVKPDGLRERTVKELALRDGKFYLVPRSTRAEFQAEIEVGSPDLTADETTDTVQVIGFVVSAIHQPALRLLERLGKVRRL